jgi:hypothetical protein
VGLGKGHWGLNSYLMSKISVWEDKNVLGMDSGDSCATLRMSLTPLNYILKNS